MAPSTYEDTDPDLRVPSKQMLDESERRPERKRSIFLPLGVLAVLVLGVHAAADQFASWAFMALNWLSNIVQASFGWFSEAFLSEPEARKRVLAEALDVDRSRAVAAWMALFVEIGLVVRLAAACLGAAPPELDVHQRAPKTGMGRLRLALLRPLKKLGVLLERTGGYFAHLSVEKIYLPISVAIATLAGIAALFIALDNAFFSLGRHLPASLGAGLWLSPVPAAIASSIVLWRLGLPALTGTLARCQLVSERDVRSGEPATRRALRGIWGAVFILPIMVAGLWAGTPLGLWVERLWGAG